MLSLENNTTLNVVVLNSRQDCKELKQQPCKWAVGWRKVDRMIKLEGSLLGMSFGQ